MALRKFLFQSSEGYHEEQAAVDEIALGKLTLSGLAGIALDGGGQRAINFATPTAAGDLATKAYADSIAVGLRDFKDSVRAATTAALPAHGFASGVITASANGALPAQDGVTLVVGNRLLVKNESASHLEHGIYDVTAVGDGANPFVLTRSIDADASTEVTAGMYMIVEEGTANADTAWVLSTNNPITLNTTALAFTKFSSLAQLNANAGLLKSGDDLSVELNTAADAQGAGADGGSSGLEFDITGGAGKLRAAVHATGGLERSASGLAIKIDDSPDTLDSGANGLKVTGVPLSFKINGTATSANVTATKVNRLVDDGATDAADDLHDHEDLMIVRQADGNIAKGDGVYYSENDGIQTGDCTVDAKSRIIAVANAVILDNATGKAKKSGVVTGVLSGASAGARYFMSATGQPALIGTLPAGARTVQVGIAKNATDLDVMIFDYGKKAA